MQLFRSGICRKLYTPKTKTELGMNQSGNQQINTADQNVDQGRRRFIRTTAGGVVLAATGPSLLSGCTSFAQVPDTAISAWSSNESFDDVRIAALSHAILAPNPHNMQPWLVDLSAENTVLVAIDPERVLPETDPDGRQIMIVGCTNGTYRHN